MEIYLETLFMYDLMIKFIMYEFITEMKNTNFLFVLNGNSIISIVKEMGIESTNFYTITNEIKSFIAYNMKIPKSMGTKYFHF